MLECIHNWNQEVVEIIRFRIRLYNKTIRQIITDPAEKYEYESIYQTFTTYKDTIDDELCKLIKLLIDKR